MPRLLDTPTPCVRHHSSDGHEPGFLRLQATLFVTYGFHPVASPTERGGGIQRREQRHQRL